MTCCLDTSFVVNYFRKGGDWISAIAKFKNDHDLIAISVISYGELLHGALRARNPAKEKEKLREFITNFEVSIFPLSASTAEIFSELKVGLEKSGQVVDNFDLLIGATAIENKAVMVTDNLRHFSRFPGLKIYR